MGQLMPVMLCLSDDCPGALVQFEARAGVFIEGQVTPALGGVEITVTAPGQETVKVLTDDKGQYRWEKWVFGTMLLWHYFSHIARLC